MTKNRKLVAKIETMQETVDQLTKTLERYEAMVESSIKLIDYAERIMGRHINYRTPEDET